MDSATKYALSLFGQSGTAAPGEPKEPKKEVAGGNMEAEAAPGTYDPNAGEPKELEAAGGNMEDEAAPGTYDDTYAAGEPKELEAEAKGGNILEEAGNIDLAAALEAPGPDLNVNVKGFPQVRQLRSDNLF